MRGASVAIDSPNTTRDQTDPRPQDSQLIDQPADRCYWLSGRTRPAGPERLTQADAKSKRHWERSQEAFGPIRCFRQPVHDLAASLAITQLLVSLLYGLTPTDPATFALVAIGLVTATVVACRGRRASRLHPMTPVRLEQVPRMRFVKFRQRVTELVGGEPSVSYRATVSHRDHFAHKFNVTMSSENCVLESR